MDGFLSDSDFLTPGTNVVGPSASPVPSSGGDTVSGPGLTLGTTDAPPPADAPVSGSGTAPLPAPAAPAATADAQPKYLTDEEFLGPDATQSSSSGILNNSPDDGYISSGLKSLGTAAIKGLSNSLGVVGNLHNFADYLVARGEHAVTGKPVADIYADIKAQRQKEEAASPLHSLYPPEPPSGEDISAPILKHTGEYQPQTESGKMLQSGLETAFGMVGPGAGVPEAGIGEGLLTMPLRAAPGNIVAGGAAQGITDETGDPLLGMAGGNGIAGVGHIAGNAIGSFARPFAEDIPVIGPKFAGTRDAMAGEQLRARATNPDVVERALTPGPMQPGVEPNYSLVPGSHPTLGQLTNDMGILQAEREAQTADNSEFNLRQGEQNTAQLAALRGAKPADASAMSAPEAFQAHLNAINQAHDVAIGLLADRAKQEGSGLSPTMTPEDRGAAIRNGIETIRQETKAAREAVRRAIDPEGTLNVVAKPVQDTVSDISSNMGRFSKPPEGEEASLLRDGLEFPEVVPFRDLMDYDQRVTDAMKAERKNNGESQAWGRLSRLKGATMSTINDAVAHQEAWEAAHPAVAGEPSDTINQRLEDNLDDLVSRQRVNWNINADQTRSVSRGSVAGTGTDAGGFPGVGAVGGSGSIRATGEAGRGASQAAGDQGISPSPLQPNADAETVSRINASKAADRAYAQTYKNKPISDMLAGPFKGVYKAPDTAVARNAVIAGDEGYGRLKTVLKAANSDPNVMAAARDQLVSHLSNHAQNMDATVNPQEFAKWQQKYGPAIRAMNEAVPGFANRFKTAARATEELMAAGVAKKQAIDAFDKSQAAKFIGKTNPIEVENQVGSLLSGKQNGPTQMRALVEQAKNNPAALNGLRSAGIDWMMRQFSNAAEAPGTSENLLSAAKFVKFVRDQSPVLSELYSPEQMNAFRAVAADLERGNRSVTATRIKGSPGTAKDILPFREKSESHTGEIVGLIEGIKELGEHFHEGNYGKAALLAGVGLGGLKGIKYLKTLREAGIDKVQDAVKDALLNPERARYYLGRSSPKEAQSKLHALTRSLRRSLIMQPVVTDMGPH